MEIMRKRPPASKKRPASSAEAELPPVVPESIIEIDEARLLLGYYVRDGGKMREAQTDMLKELCGCVPRVEDASKWKIALGRLRKEKLAAAG